MSTPLTNEELQKLAPSLFTKVPYHEVSDRYHFISTIEIIEEIRFYRWYPVHVQESGVRKSEKEGFQRHLVRFRHFDDLLSPSENAVELLLFNSHDRSTAFHIGAGVYRFVCANGLVIADTVFESFKIRHIGEKEDDVRTAIETLTAFKPKLERKIRTFASIVLDYPEKLTFARQALPLRFDEHLRVDPKELLMPRREEDRSNDLYTVMNVIQENLLRGDLPGINKETGRRFSSKAITHIPKDAVINKGVWEIAERIAAIKMSKDSRRPHEIAA